MRQNKAARRMLLPKTKQEKQKIKQKFADSMEMVHANLNRTVDMNTQKCVINSQKMASSKITTRLDAMELPL